ncbi:MAG: ferritin family protein [Leptospiraceae bacterium]|nr:ferritin family protein [Leptospiraceae bacterium]
MNHIKDTTLLEAVAGAIQYEKDCFDFYLKVYESIQSENSVKELFKQLAEDVDEHIKLIQNMYNELKGGTTFPNLKEMTAIHKFHSTAIFKVMKKVERNVGDVSKDSLENVEKAMRAAEDARDFYDKLKDRFANPDIKILFKKLADYNEDNRLMIEAQNTFLSQKDKTDYYWENEELAKTSS